MKVSRFHIAPALLIAACLCFPAIADEVPAPVPAATDEAWPPPLPGEVNGTVTISSREFLTIPASMKATFAKPDALKFTMAKKPPTVDLAFHGNLPDRALNGTGWSAWGDIAVAKDGRVYCGIGDHGDNAGFSHAFIYRWDPTTKALAQIVDCNKADGSGPGDPTWSKVHARILEGADGDIYFTPTLNNGAVAYQTKWTEKVPGGQLFRFDPAGGETKIVGSFPGEVTATTLMDKARNVFYATLEGKTTDADVALTAFDLTTNKVIYQSAHDAVVADRNVAMAKNGALFFNGKGGLWKYDPASKSISPTKTVFPDKATMRSSTPESAEGYIYGTTMSPGRFFRYVPAKDELQVIGPDFLNGDYTAVTVLSPDEKFVYYLPGSHGGALETGVPVVQYNIKSGKFKVLAFLGAAIDKSTGYLAGGSYGAKMSADGSTLYVNFNGQPHTNIDKHAAAFGLTAFAAIHIPKSER